MNYTDEQQKVIDCKSTNVFAISGAGSGKSTVIVARIARMVADGIDPKTIAAVTFTNAGSKVMQAKLDLERYLEQPCTPNGPSAYRPLKIGFVGTLHAFLLNVIRQHGSVIGYPNGRFTILDEEQEAEFREGIVAKFNWKGTDKALKEAILKGPPLFNGAGQPPVGIVAAGYWQELRKQKLLTFDAILILGERLLKSTLLTSYVPGTDVVIPFEHWLIDECQDSSPADFRIYAMLPGTKFMVGDDSQAIYGFRGGDVTQCLALTQDPNWTTLTLESNFRSGAEICLAANNLIAHNQDRYPKRTISAVDWTGNVQFAKFRSPPVEASFIAQEIGRLANPEEVAVLLRTNDLVKEYADHLRAASIPVAESRPPARPKDWAVARAVITFLAQPENDYAAFRCVGMVYGWPKAKELQGKATAAFTSLNTQWVNTSPVPLDDIRSTLLEMGCSVESALRVDEAKERLADGATVADLLVELGRDDEYATEKGVHVGTIHSFKGREADHVFLPASEQEIIPGTRKDLDIASERRLFYVAVTRARYRLCVSYCEERTQKWGPSPRPVPVRPSQFVAEMKGNHVFNP